MDYSGKKSVTQRSAGRFVREAALPGKKREENVKANKIESEAPKKEEKTVLLPSILEREQKRNTSMDVSLYDHYVGMYNPRGFLHSGSDAPVNERIDTSMPACLSKTTSDGTIYRTPYGPCSRVVCCYDDLSVCYGSREFISEYDAPAFFSPLGADCYRYASSKMKGFVPKAWNRFKMRGGLIFVDGGLLAPETLNELDSVCFENLRFMAYMSMHFLVACHVRSRWIVGQAPYFRGEDSTFLFCNGFIPGSVHLVASYDKDKDYADLLEQFDRTLLHVYLPTVLLSIGKSAEVPKTYREKLYALGKLLLSDERRPSDLEELLVSVKHRSPWFESDLKMQQLEALVEACSYPGESTIRHWRLVKISKYAESFLRAPVSALLSLVEYSLAYDKGSRPNSPTEVTVFIRMKSPLKDPLGSFKFPIRSTTDVPGVYLAVLATLYSYCTRNQQVLTRLGIFRGGVEDQGGVEGLAVLKSKYNVSHFIKLVTVDAALLELASYVSVRWKAPPQFGKLVCSRLVYTALVVGKKGTTLIAEDWENAWRRAGDYVEPRAPIVVDVKKTGVGTLKEDTVFVVYPDEPWLSKEDWTDLHDRQFYANFVDKNTTRFNPDEHFPVIPNVPRRSLDFCWIYEQREKEDCTVEDRRRRYETLLIPDSDRIHCSYYFTIDYALHNVKWSGVKDMLAYLKSKGVPVDDTLRKAILNYHAHDTSLISRARPLDPHLDPETSKEEYHVPLSAAQKYEAQIKRMSFLKLPKE